MIFVDTSAWLALADSHDKAHTEARGLGRRIARGEFGKQVTTNYVVTEAVNMIRHHLSLAAAISFGRGISKSDEIRTFWIEPVHHEESLQLMATRGDKDWSLTDCTSFVVMRALQIPVAFALDEDFVQAGFSILP